MATRPTERDLEHRLAVGIGALDALRAAGLVVATAEEQRLLDGLRVERARRVARFGDRSAPVTAVDADVAEIGGRREVLAAEATRASTPTPVPAAESGALYGRVVGPDGKGGVAGVVVKAKDRKGRIVATTKTDESGAYTLDLPAEAAQEGVRVQLVVGRKIVFEDSDIQPVGSNAVRWRELTMPRAGGSHGGRPGRRD
jgi:hypothetical protein